VSSVWSLSQSFEGNHVSSYLSLSQSFDGSGSGLGAFCGEGLSSFGAVLGSVARFRFVWSPSLGGSSRNEFFVPSVHLQRSRRVASHTTHFETAGMALDEQCKQANPFEKGWQDHPKNKML
jgi:hypothetical protein